MASDYDPDYDDYAYPPPARRRAPQPAPAVWPLVFLLLLVIGLGALAGWWLWPRPDHAVDPNAKPRAITVVNGVNSEDEAFHNVYVKAEPAVVHITSLAVQRDYFTRRVQAVPKGIGSGFIWDDDGHIVTNYHVIRGANGAKVTLADGTSYVAELVGTSPDKDLAVLHIKAPKKSLTKIDIGESKNLLIGQRVFAIGNPYGLDRTMTTGIVSALNREIGTEEDQTIQNVIQTDTPINPGNSGGPLLDRYARLIGVTTAIYSPSGSSSGIGFAIPVDEVNQVIPELIRTGSRGG